MGVGVPYSYYNSVHSTAYMDSDTCPHCGNDYTDPDDVAPAEYMYHGHLMNDCPDPNLRERAYLNASPVERMEVWPNA